MRIIVLAVLLTSFSGQSQTDSLGQKYDKINWIKHDLNSQKNPIWKKSIVSSVLMISALSINSLPLKQNIQNKIRAPFYGYSTSLDDYIQYAPIGIMYGADLFKIKAEHSVWNQTKFLFMSEVITGGIVFGLKYGIGILRPDSSTYNSFPSGHTAQAFVAAQVLRNEFKNTNKVLANSGYLFSTSTGLLRIVNNRHWLPDVLMGAGIAIVVTNLVYHFEPLKNWKPKFLKSKSDLSLQFDPIFSDQMVGANLKLKL